MGMMTYRATGWGIDALKLLLGVKLRTSGVENLVDRPTLFVANHFTRIETFLVPFVIYRAGGGRRVRSLGTAYLFRGTVGRYFRALGGMSTRDPRRNRTIISDLMTGHCDWMIYPEGGLIKNKKTISRGRLKLEHPERKGPPHTGAAMLALKAEVAKHRYVQACAEQDVRAIEYYQQAFGLTSCEHVDRRGIVITPVTLTFYPMRSSDNLVQRAAKLLFRDLDPRMEEELKVEGSILTADSQIRVHFGEPIEVAQYLDKMTGLARKVAGVFFEEKVHDLGLRKQARRLTSACMRTIYNNTEINLDHLFAFALRAYVGRTISPDDLRRAIYLAAVQLDRAGRVRLNPALRNGVSDLVTGVPVPALDDIVALACRQKIIQAGENGYRISHERLGERHDFHQVRLQNMLQVIGNELEPVKEAVDVVKRCVNLSPARLRKHTSEALRRQAVNIFDEHYDESFEPRESKAREIGEPFFLQARKPRLGVLLVHGYLAAPEQMRPMAEHLRDRGASVYVVRLDGHGTSPEQLTQVRWQQWMATVRCGYGVVRQHDERVVVGGFSLGGVLSLLLAASLGSGVVGTFAINPPMGLRDRRASLVGPLVRFNGALRRLHLSNGHYQRLNDDTESPDINYRRDFLAGIREVRAVSQVCWRRLREVTAPTLLLQSDRDPLVTSEATRRALRRLGAADRSLETLPFDRHVIVRGEGSERVCGLVGDFVERISRVCLI